MSRDALTSCLVIRRGATTFKPRSPLGRLQHSGAGYGTRTHNLLITSQLRYQLRQPGKSREGFDEEVPVTRRLPIEPFAAYLALFILLHNWSSNPLIILPIGPGVQFYWSRPSRPKNAFAALAIATSFRFLCRPTHQPPRIPESNRSWSRSPQYSEKLLSLGLGRQPPETRSARHRRRDTLPLGVFMRTIPNWLRSDATRRG